MPSRSFSRTDRLGRQIHQVLAVAMAQESREEALRQVMLTDVEVTRDLSLARVYYYVGDADGLPAVERALGRARGFLRRRVGEQIRARQTPELRFVYDESVERGRRIEEILDDLRDDDDPFAESP